MFIEALSIRESLRVHVCHRSESELPTALRGGAARAAQVRMGASVNSEQSAKGLATICPLEEANI